MALALRTGLRASEISSARFGDLQPSAAYPGKYNPDGHFKFLHPWPGQIPPGQDSEECLSVG
jgi:hypothetical protein